MNWPLWLSITALVVVSGFFTLTGGLKTIAHTNIFQMSLLIFASGVLVIYGIIEAGGVFAIYEAVPDGYWKLFLPSDDADYPWHAIILGYPVLGIWFWCTDQSMVQSVLAARNMTQGRLGTAACGYLKGLDLFSLFQAILGFLAPPLSTVFLIGVLWKGATSKGANTILTFGTVLSLGVGFCYLKDWPSKEVWPHFLLLSFMIFIFLCALMIVVSLLTTKDANENDTDLERFLSVDYLVERLRTGRVDLLQLDSKGHEGLTSLYSQTPSATVAEGVDQEMVDVWVQAEDLYSDAAFYTGCH